MSVDTSVAQALATLAVARDRNREEFRQYERVELALNAIAANDPCPTRFVGVVDNYRFTTGAKGQVPTHRFEIICGNGLFLHVEAKPGTFASAMMNMDGGDITPKKMNRTLCVVERNVDDGMVPVQMIAEEVLPNVNDRWGNFLWNGAKVQYGDMNGLVVNLTVEGNLTVDFDGDRQLLLPKVVAVTL